MVAPAMIRLLVVLLFACNLLLIGVNVASAPPAKDRPVASLAPIPPDVPRLQMLDELDPDAFSDLAPQHCYSAGPFETVPTLIRAREALGPGAENVVERETEALVELGYWVSLPPEPSFAEAGVALQALKRAGFEDVAVVGDETGSYRVSLGYFLEEANARRRRDEVREFGFDVETRIQRDSQVRYWLDYRFSEKTLADLAATALPAGQQREVPCPQTLGP